MSRLIGYEFKKMLKRPFTVFVMTACLALTAFMAVTTALNRTINVWGPDYYGSYDAIPGDVLKEAHEKHGYTGRYDGLVVLKGFEAIKVYRTYEERFEGIWDQERLSRIAQEFASIQNDPNNFTNELNESAMWSRRASFQNQGMSPGEIDAYDEAHPIYIRTGQGHGRLDAFGSLYMLLNYHVVNADGSVLSFAEAFPYVEEPATFKSMWGPTTMTSNQSQIVGLLIALAVLAIAAPLFSDEVTTGTEEMLLATRFGRTKQVRAKIIAGLAAAVGCVVISTVVSFILSWAFYGMGGLSAPIQFDYDNIMIPFSLMNWQFILVICGLQVLGALAFAGLLMVLSAHARTAFPVVFVGAVFFFANMLLTNNIDPPYRYIAQEFPAGLVLPFSLLLEARETVFGFMPNWVGGVTLSLALTLAAAIWIISRYRRKMV
jgi:ABC-type transport system involved in multi-copper enzyme maturation permease subunit